MPALTAVGRRSSCWPKQGTILVELSAYLTRPSQI